MGRIILEGMRFRGHVGTTEAERLAGNDFLVTVGYDTDTARPGKTDRLEDSVDYSRVFDVVGREFLPECNLIENLAHRIMDSLLAEFSPRIWNVGVRVCKKYPAVDGQLEQSVIEISQ